MSNIENMSAASIASYIKFRECQISKNETIVSDEEFIELRNRIYQLRKNNDIKHLKYISLMGQLNLIKAWNKENIRR